MTSPIRINYLLAVFIMRIFFLSVFLSLAGIHAFEAGTYISTTYAKPLAYVEIGSHKQFVKNLKAFYFALRKGRKTTKTEWNSITRLVSSKITFPIFDAKKLRQIGIDLNFKFVLIALQDPDSGKEELQFFIPAKKPDSVFNFMKKSNPRPRELKRGLLLKRKNIFIAKGRNHIVFATKRKYALSGIRPAKNSLTQRADYRIIQKEFKSHSSQVARFILFEKSLDLSSVVQFFFPTGKYDRSSSGKGISRHIRAIGGEFNVDNKGLYTNLRYIVDEKFFKDKTLYDLGFRVIPKNKPKPRLGNLGSDHFKGEKIAYVSMLLDTSLFYSLLEKKFLVGSGNTAIRNKLKQIFQNYIRGDISGILSNYIGQSPMLDLLQWEFYLSFGLKDNVNVQDLQKTLEPIIGGMAKKTKIKLRKSRFQNHPLWEVKNLKGSPKGTRLNQSLFFLFQPKELNIFTQKRNAISLLTKKGNSLIKSNERLLKTKEENMVFFLLINIDFMYRKIKQIPFAQAFSMYLTYFKNLDAVLGFVSQKRKSIELYFKILLK